MTLRTITNRMNQTTTVMTESAFSQFDHSQGLRLLRTETYQIITKTGTATTREPVLTKVLAQTKRKISTIEKKN